MRHWNKVTYVPRPWSKNTPLASASLVSANLRSRELFSDAMDDESYEGGESRLDEMMSIPLIVPTDTSYGGVDA